MRRLLILLSALSGFGLLALAPAAAYADPGNGAQIVNNHECMDLGNGLTQCTSTTGEINTTMTPSGNLIVEANLRFTYSLNGPGVVVTNSGQIHEQGLAQDQAIQVLQERTRATSHIEENGISETCVSSAAFHFANGQVQYDHTDSVCTSP